MRLQLQACLSAVVLAAAVTGAQTPGASSQTPQPHSGSATNQPTEPAPESTAAPITLVGCIARADAETSAQQAAANRVSPQFVLRVSSSRDAGGAPQRTGDTPAATQYHLVPSTADLRLADHLGHRVEVRGRLKVAAAGARSRTNQGVSTSVPSGSTGMETIPPPGDKPEARKTTEGGPEMPVPSMLTVTSVRMLASGCGQ